ncbi:MAG TPA: ATP-binding protein [Pantanalinema sp.]
MVPSPSPPDDLQRPLLDGEQDVSLERLWFLVHAGGILSSSLDTMTTLRSVARLAVPSLADCCLIDLFEEGGLRRIVAVHSDPGLEGLTEELRRFPPDLSKEEGVSVVLRTGKPLFIPELLPSFLDGIALDEDHLALLRRLSPRSLISVAMSARGDLFGAISLFRSKGDHPYTSEDLLVAEILAQRAADALDNARLYLQAARARDRYHSLLDDVDGIVWEGEPGTLAFTFVSKQAEAILGYPREAWLLPGFWQSHLHPDDRAAVVKQCQESTDAGRDHRLSYRMIGADGRTLWINDHVRVLTDQSGRPTQLRGIMLDVTQQHALEAERARLQGEEQASRAEAAAAKKLDRLKDELLQSVSHELRTPLTSIFGYSEFLEEGTAGALNAQQGEYVQQIRAASLQLERLVDDLLDNARISAGTFRLNLAPSDLGRQIREAVRALRLRAAEAGVRLEVELAPGDLTLAMDPQRIQQVLTNLIANALKFTPREGRITVRARREGQRLHCEVQDTGIGIAPEDLPKLFQRFAQLEAGRRERGTGLGLSISKALVEAHGGTIGVFSQKGKGTTFWFTLPTTARRSQAATLS